MLTLCLCKPTFLAILDEVASHFIESTHRFRDVSFHVQPKEASYEIVILKRWIPWHLLNVEYRRGLDQTVTVGLVYNAIWHTYKIIGYIFFIIYISSSYW